MVNDEIEAHARPSDPPTSHIAAKKMKKATKSERRILDAMLATKVRMTTLCIARFYHDVVGRPGDTQAWWVSPRMAPLERKGIIKRDGTKTVLNSSGKIAKLTAWIIKPPRVRKKKPEESNGSVNSADPVSDSFT